MFLLLKTEMNAFLFYIAKYRVSKHDLQFFSITPENKIEEKIKHRYAYFPVLILFRKELIFTIKAATFSLLFRFVQRSRALLVVEKLT